MTSREDSDEGGHHGFPSFPVFGSGSGSTGGPEYDNIIEYWRLKCREVSAQFSMLSRDKERLERDLVQMQTFNAREYTELSGKYEILRARHDDLVRNKNCVDCKMLKKQLQETITELNSVMGERDPVLAENTELSTKNEALTKEIDTLTRCRDDALKESDMLREKIEQFKSRSEDFALAAHLESANEEIQRLKKSRDHAIQEREKIVQECESVRKLCDVIRKERDSATSNQLEAIRQRDEAYKKIKELNEKIDSNSNRNSLRSYSPFYDVETEKVEVDISRVPSSSDLGLLLSGGDLEENANQKSFVTVAGIEPTSVFAGKLKINDFIYQVNNRDCSTSTKQAVLNAIRSSTGRCSITVKRKKKRSTYPTQMNLSQNRDIEYISKVDPVMSRNAKLRQIEESLESFKDLSDVEYSDSPRTRPYLHGKSFPTGMNLQHTNVSGNSRQHNRMVNSCTQTETKRMSLDLSSNNNCFVPPRMGYNNTSTNTPNTPSPVTQQSSKSASKLGGMFQKFRDKLQLNNYKESQENDALAELDRVLDLDDSSKSPPTKESISKKIRRKKESEKNVGTWPRTSMNPTNHDSHSGTIVQPRKKVRPQLYPIFSDALQANHAENNSFVPVATPQNPKQNRNSNPIPFEMWKVNQNKYSDPPKPTYRSYERPVNTNRFSLQPQSQNSIDFIPIKSSHEMPASYKQSTASNYPVKLTRESDFFSSPMKAFESETIPENPGNTNTLPVHMRNKPSSVSQSHRPTSHLYNLYQFSMGPPPHHTYNRRYPSPSTLIPSDMLGSPIEALPHHSHGSSIDYPYRNPKFQSSKEAVPSYIYEGGTFPRNKDNQRIRIPSNQSMTSRGSGVKNSSGSIDCGSERASPVPTFNVTQINPARMNEDGVMKFPERCIQIDNVWKPLGFTIFDSRLEDGRVASISIDGKGRGIFVASVTENSIAKMVGLKIGDQLLEFCGINMRTATFELAAKFLAHYGKSITMLVQYNPDEYQELLNAEMSRSARSTTTRSGSPTPQNSPHTTRSVMSADSLQQQFAELTTSNGGPVGQIVSQRSIRSSQMSSKASKDFCDSIEHQSSQSSPNSFYIEAPRVLCMETRNSKELGISLLGGNKYGIFVHSVKEGSIADRAGLQIGDQILEYNGTDLNRATAEEAAYELAKSADKVRCLVQYNPQKCNEIKNCPGDSFYIRVNFDRNSDFSTGELAFQKDEVLYVDNTMFRGTSQWRAYKLDEHGNPSSVCGVIPSQRSIILSENDDSESTARRGSARRSFFKRMKPRSSSRDSRELASYSSTHLSLYSDSSVLSELDAMPTYQRVERLHYKYRPVLILGLGLLTDSVVNKLIDDFQDQFLRCKVDEFRAPKESMDQALQSNMIVDYKRRGSHYECTTVKAIREARGQNKHCVMDICVSAVERLYRNQIYPIVLLIRFKRARQIKDIIMEQTTNTITGKVAQETCDHAQKLESDYRQFISAIIPGGVNITHISTQIKEAVDAEQKKILWVPVN